MVSLNRLLLFVFFCLLYREECSASFYPIYNGLGSHYENGYSIGLQAKDRIQKYISTYPTVTVLQNCLLTSCSVDFHNLVKYNRNIWPQYFEELSGIADGAQVEVTDLQLLSFKHEILALLNKLSSSSTDGNSIESINSDLLECSDILLNKPTFSGFAHNEDGWNGTLNFGYFSSYSITNDNEFFGFQYPGSIIGHSFGVNKHGVAVSMNAVFPTNVTIPGRGDYFLCRALLDSKNISDAINIINDYDKNGPACASGASLNIGYMNDNKQVTIANIEVSNYQISIQYYGTEKQQQESYGYHYNMYLRLNTSQKYEPSSIHRLNRTKQLIKENGLNGMQDVVNILGDTQDPEYPLYRESKPPDHSSTLTTAILDIGNQILYVFDKCNPKICDPAFTVPFNFFDTRKREI